MRSIQSILAVVDGRPMAADAVAKAVLLARKTGARVELFMCEAERAYALSQSYITTGVEEARRACIESAHQYLRALWDSSGATDIEVTLDARCESPLYESIVRKVLRSRPDLVIKNAAGPYGPGSLEATDWQLMRTCPATLMLARGARWAERPRLVAAVDPSDCETAGLTAAILEAAGAVSSCVGAELDVVYAETAQRRQESGGVTPEALRHLFSQQGGEPGVHVLSGTPEEQLAAFARSRHCDAMLLGALTHRPGLTAQVGSLTSKLVEELACDLILVKPVEYVSPIQESRRRSSPRSLAG